MFADDTVISVEWRTINEPLGKYERNKKMDGLQLFIFKGKKKNKIMVRDELLCYQYKLELYSENLQFGSECKITNTK